MHEKEAAKQHSEPIIDFIHASFYGLEGVLFAFGQGDFENQLSDLAWAGRELLDVSRSRLERLVKAIESALGGSVYVTIECNGGSSGAFDKVIGIEIRKEAARERSFLSESRSFARGRATSIEQYPRCEHGTREYG